MSLLQIKEIIERMETQERTSIVNVRELQSVKFKLLRMQERCTASLPNWVRQTLEEIIEHIDEVTK